MTPEKFNPETATLRQWPFLYNSDTHHWDVEWSELIGFLIGCGLIALAVFIIGLALYTGLVVFGG